MTWGCHGMTMPNEIELKLALTPHDADGLEVSALVGVPPRNPLKRWKLGKVDKSALKKWDEYSVARNEMFARTHTASSSWTIVRADDKQFTRVNLIRDLLSRFEFEGKDHRAICPTLKSSSPFAKSSCATGGSPSSCNRLKKATRVWSTVVPSIPN